MLENVLVDEEGKEQKVIYGEHYTSLNKYQDNLKNNLEYLLLGEKIPEELIIDGIWIGVMSSNSSAGCTDFSIGLANFIKRYDDSVCYVEANESGDLAAMSEFYDMEKMEDNHYIKNGIDYWHQSIDQLKKYVVIDLGKCNAVKVNLMNQCKIKVLLTDAKPYRMSDALNVYRSIDDENTKVCLNYSNQEDFQKLCETYLQNINVGIIGHHTNIFAGEDLLYQELMKEYLDTSPKDTGNRISFILPGDKIKQFLKPKKKTISKNVAVTSADEQADDLVENQEAESITDEKEMKETIEQESAEPVEVLTEDIQEPEIEEWKEADTEITITEESKDEIEPEILEEVNTDIVESTNVDKKKKQVKNKVLLFLVVGVFTLAASTLIPYIKDLKNQFSFNIPPTEQTTELTDDNLNIDEDIKISVLEVEGADGYEVSYSTDENFEKKTTVIVEVTTADKAVESLASGKTYYVRVRAFKFNEDGIKVYGDYTEVQKIRT